MGRLSVGQVREWDPARMQDVATSLQHSRSALVSLGADLPAGAGPTVWQGPAASAAYLREESLAAAERAMVTAVAAVQRAVDEAAARVRAVQAALDQVQRLAAGHRLRVDDDGVVRDTGCLPTPADAGRAAAMERDRERAREAARASVHEVLRAAMDIDDGLASVLLAAAHDGITAGARPPSTRRGAPARRSRARFPSPPPAGPYDAATWWRALTPAEREEAARSMPAALGRLDGLPPAVRDEANRTVMSRERRRLQRLLPGLRRRWTGRCPRSTAAATRRSSPTCCGSGPPRTSSPRRPPPSRRSPHWSRCSRRTARDDGCCRSAPGAGG